MRILEEHETEGLVKVPRGPASPFYVALCRLKKGQSLLIERSEWKRKHAPFYMATRLEKRHDHVKFERYKLPDGWLIKRIK